MLISHTVIHYLLSLEPHLLTTETDTQKVSAHYPEKVNHPVFS